jgi:hypothetical protein
MDVKDLKIESTIKTPEITFLAKEGRLTLSGRSIPENSIDFFKPLNDWLNQYFVKPNPSTRIEVKLEYFNTSTSKSMLDMFKFMEGHNGLLTSIEIDWYYENDDEDMLEAGEDYQAILNIPFNLVSVEEL